MKILIVDDERDARKFLRIIATRAFHTIIEAENGKEGLRLAAEHKPDLIISDVLMPVMDGFYFLREIKMNEALKHTPFVFYSATYTEHNDIKLAMSMGAEAYIIKPKEAEELWAEIGLALEKSKKEKTVRSEFATPEDEREYLRQHTQIMAVKLEQTVMKLNETLAAQQRSEEALRQRMQELEKFFSAAPDLFCIIGEDFNLSRINPACERTLGYTREELLACKFLDLIHPDDIDLTKEAIFTQTAAGKATNLVNRCRRKDGVYRRLEWHAAASGKFTYAIGRDITDSRPVKGLQ